MVRRQKKLASARGEICCEVCGFDYGAFYGPVGARFIEVHHSVPLPSVDRQPQTKLFDLALLRSSYHRMTHRGEELLTAQKLIESIVAASLESVEDEE